MGLQEEMSALFKPKKKKKKKEKKLRTKDTAELIAALEAEAAQAGGSDLGNRKLRADHKDAVAQEELAKVRPFACLPCHPLPFLCSVSPHPPPSKPSLPAKKSWTGFLLPRACHEISHSATTLSL